MPVPYETAYGPLPEVVAWLTANGIDPADVPVDGEITIEVQNLAGDRYVRYSALLRNEDGHRYLDPATNEAAQEERIAPLKVDPPENVHVEDTSK